MKRKKKAHYDWHHRKPRSLGGKNDDRNMAHVSVSRHMAWHQLFRNYTPQEIADVINETWLDPDFYFSVKQRR